MLTVEFMAMATARTDPQTDAAPFSPHSQGVMAADRKEAIFIPAEFCVVPVPNLSRCHWKLPLYLENLVIDVTVHRLPTSPARLTLGSERPE